MSNVNVLIQAVSAALASVAANGAAAKAGKGEAVNAVRKVAAKAAELGFTHEQAAKVWQSVAKLEKRPAGTWKPYTKHVQGFVILAASGANLDTGNEGKPYTQAQAVEAHKLATTPSEVLAELARISEATATFRKRIGGDEVTGFEWKRPTADEVGAILSMLAAHPSESEDVTAKVSKADKDAAEAASLLAEMVEASEESEAEPARIAA